MKRKRKTRKCSQWLTAPAAEVYNQYTGADRAALVNEGILLAHQARQGAGLPALHEKLDRILTLLGGSAGGRLSPEAPARPPNVPKELTF